VNDKGFIGFFLFLKISKSRHYWKASICYFASEELPYNDIIKPNWFNISYFLIPIYWLKHINHYFYENKNQIREILEKN
jgi:hypothetical protein